MRKIVKNAIKCKRCGETIYSVSTHDYKMCQCGSCGIDGGHDYIRRIYISSPEEDFEELSEYEEIL